MDKKYEFSRLIYSRNYIREKSKKIKLLGLDSNLFSAKFLSLRLISTLVLFIIIFIVSNIGYILAPIISIAFYLLTEKIMIDDKIKKRQRILEEEAITFFEILYLAIDAGRNLEEALKVTTSSTNSNLSREFEEVLREVKLGKSLSEAMEDAEKRIPSDNINNIILSLINADIYGSEIISNLNNQIEYLREKRMLEVKATISKLPIKISVVSVLLFLPLLLLIILGPVVLNYIG